MGAQASTRAIEAAEGQQQREAQKRLRQLERRRKEQAKLSAAEQARLEVESFENRLEVLLSVHKDQGPVWDWVALASSLAPVPPRRNSYHELRARQEARLLPQDRQVAADTSIEHARLRDEQTFQQALDSHRRLRAEWEKLKALAPRILAGDPKAYTQALSDLSPFGEISGLGSTLCFTVHNPQLLECNLKANGVGAIPAEILTLTAANKLSVKPMPRARFHELYQDYICSCILRIAREVFALLPIGTLLITASADTLEPRDGQTIERPVLSVAIPREAIAELDFEQIDPSDAMETFLQRGDFKATRKSGAFAPITPLTPTDLQTTSFSRNNHTDLLVAARGLREELKVEIGRLSPRSDAPPGNDRPPI